MTPVRSKGQILPAKTDGGLMTTVKSRDHGIQSLAAGMQSLTAVLSLAVQMTLLGMW